MARQEERGQEHKTSEYRYLQWTEQDWEEYARSTIEISLPFFEQLMGATEELSRGARPGKEAREHYAQIAERARATWDHATEQFGPTSG